MTRPRLAVQDNFPDMPEVSASVVNHFRGFRAPFPQATDTDTASDDEQAACTHKKRWLKSGKVLQQTLWSKKGLPGPTRLFTPVNVNQLCMTR